MEPRSLYVKGAHDLELHVLEWSSEGVPLILLHGYGNEAHLWDDLAPLIAPHYRVIAVDLRGHGDSGWDRERRYEVETLVDDLEALTEALSIDRFVLVGFSLGGRASTLFAGRHPERLAGLVLVDIGPEVDARGSTRIRSEVTENRAPTFKSIEEYASALSLNYPAGSRDVLLRMARYGLKQREDGLYELKIDPALRGEHGPLESSEQMAAREATTEKAMWEALKGVPCPTLVIRGAASDILSPETADKMVDEVLANGRLVVVPQAAHSVVTDNPEGFNRAICDFVLEND